MIVSAHVLQYLDQALGITVPGFIVEAAVAQAVAAEPAMTEAGYSDETKLMVQTYAAAIIAAAGAPRRIKSQGAPSGASRSFDNQDSALTLLRRTLTALDTAGTVAAIVGPDPASKTMFMVVC